jgi:hypothetical protein
MVAGTADAGQDVLVDRRGLLVRVGALGRVVGDYHVADGRPVDGVGNAAGHDQDRVPRRSQ